MMKDGDRIDVQFDMYTYGEYFPNNSPYMAMLDGPVVLAAATGTSNLDGIIANDSRMGHVAHGALISREEAPVIIKDADDRSKKIVPVKDEPLSFKMKDLLHRESANE